MADLDSILGRAKTLVSIAQHPDRFYNTQLPISLGTVHPSPEVMRPRREAHQTPKSTAKVKTGGVVPSVLHASSWLYFANYVD
jgi:hypothetical protein